MMHESTSQLKAALQNPALLFSKYHKDSMKEAKVKDIIILSNMEKTPYSANIIIHGMGLCK